MGQISVLIWGAVGDGMEERKGMPRPLSAREKLKSSDLVG